MSRERVSVEVMKAVMARELWTFKDCGIYLKRDPEMIEDHYSRLGTWPAPVGDGIYRSKEVRAWALRPAPKRKYKENPTDKLYIMEQPGNGGLLKIGIAHAPEKRATAIKFASGFDTEIRLVIECDDENEARQLEKYLHNIYAENRTRGEWFSGLSVTKIEASALYWLEL